MSLALHLFRATAPNLSLDDCENVLSALHDLRHRIVAQGSTGDLVRNGEWQTLAIAISRSAPISVKEALFAITCIDRLEYSIQKPTKMENATK